MSTTSAFPFQLGTQETRCDHCDQVYGQEKAMQRCCHVGNDAVKIADLPSNGDALRPNVDYNSPLHSRYERVDVDLMRRAADLLLTIGLFAFLLAGCQTAPSGIQQTKIEMAQRIAAEPPGDYYIGRRYFKPDFKVWGYVRKPGQPWSSAQLVMLNEKQKLAPDRERLSFGSDNNYEYKLQGYFSGDKVYEPASNTIYPEFVLKSYEVISTTPAPIFKSQMSGRSQTAVTRYTIEKPE